MKRIGIYDARSRLSELVDRVEGGEDVILTRRGRPVVRMTRARDAAAAQGRAAAVKRIRALRDRMGLKITRAQVRRAIEKGRA